MSKKRNRKYNWELLKQEFFKSEEMDVAVFVRQRLSKETANSGHIAKKTKGWGEEKRTYQKEILEEAQKRAKRELIEKLKIKLKDVMAGKKLSYELQLSFLECLGKILQGKTLSEAEQKFLRSFPPKTIDMITKWLQIELGEPTKIAALGFLGEDVEEVKIQIIKSRDEIRHKGNNGPRKDSKRIPEKDKDNN